MTYANPYELIDRRLSAIEQVLQELRQQHKDKHTNVAVDDETPMSVEQTASFLGVAPQTIYQNIKKIPHKKRFGRLYFFKSELIAYLEEQAA